MKERDDYSKCSNFNTANCPKYIELLKFVSASPRHLKTATIEDLDQASTICEECDRFEPLHG